MIGRNSCVAVFWYTLVVLILLAGLITAVTPLAALVGNYPVWYFPLFCWLVLPVVAFWLMFLRYFRMSGDYYGFPNVYLVLFPSISISLIIYYLVGVINTTLVKAIRSG